MTPRMPRLSSILDRRPRPSRSFIARAAPSGRALAVALACALTALAALAESALAVQIGRDDQVESLLRRADELVAEGRLADAVKTLLLVEDRAAAARAEDPTVRPLVLGPDGVYRSPGHEVWRRVVAGGADALAAYRAARAPLVRELIASALAPPRDVAALAAVGRTYPLVEGAAEGLVRLGDLLLERGEVEQALAAYTAAKAKAPGRPALAPTLLASAEAASAQARALVERMRRGAAASDRDAERRAARRWPMPGGAPDRARASPEAILPGAPLWELPLASGDLAAASLAGFARRGFAPPLLWRPVTCGERVYVQDARTVVAVDLERGQASWRYTASDPQDDREDPARVPERVRASYLAPTVLGGRVYATLNRNTPPIYEPYEGPPEKGQQLVSRRADDWRLVALDAETGALAWDAMRAPAVAAATRAARAISSPLVAYGQVFVTLVEGDAGELSTLLLAFDQATGALAWRMFLGSASLENFLDLASLLPPPSAREGRVFVQGLGLVACVDPLRQDLEWVHAHPAVPAASFKRVIERDRRFDLAPPVVQGSVVVCAPPDAVYLLGLDASTGRERWRMPRGALTQVLGVARGRVIVAGAAGGRAVVLAIDPATGLVAWRRSLEAQGLAGRGVASEARVLVPLAEGWVALGADDGAIEARGYLPAGTPAAGHWLALPGRLVYASAHSIALYEPRERSLTRLAVAGERGDPGTADAYAALLAATGRPKDALSVIERAVERAFDPARQAALAAIGFDIGRRADRERARAGDEEAALDLGVLASRFVRGRTGEAAYLATLTERLLAAGRAGDAALVLQRVGVTGRGARIAVAFGVEAPAAAWARERLRRLRRDAPAAFAAHDDLAARAFGRATEARAPEAYEEVIRAFPGSRYEQLALLALADLHESRELASQAARALEDHDRRFPDHAEAVSVLLRLARIYLATGRLEDERRALGELARRFGDVRLEGESETIGAFARRRLASIDAAPRAPRLQLGSEPSALGKTFQAWTDLAAEEPRVIAPPGLDPERAPFALVAAERSLAAHDPDTGALLWRWEAPPAAAGASAELHHGRIALAGGALALVHQGGLQALDAATGRWLWRHDAADLLSLDPGAAPRPERLQLLALGFDGASGPRWPVDYLLRELQAAIGPVRPAVDPDPIRGLQPAGDRLVANVAGAVVCLDGARGTLLWRTRRSERLSGAPLVGPDGAGGSIVLVRQEAPAVLIGLDLQTGAERWVARPGERDPRLTLAPVVPPLAPERAFFVADANRLMAISFADGAVETLRQLPFWPRELVPEPSGRAVCVIPHRGPQQPAAVVYQSRTGEELCQLEAPDALRVNRAEFLDDELYLLAGDYRDAQLYAVNWSTGQARWTWTPQRGHSFQELLVTRDHVILPRTAARPGMVYVVDRALGSVHRTLEIPRRRVVNAALIRGVLCVSTNRGLLGYGRLDPARLLEEQGELAARLALSPDDSSLVLALADRQFKAGELDLALATLGRGLEREGLDQRAHATLLRQLLGYQEGLDEGPEVEVGRVARAPLIDGELSDPWPLEQSFVLSSARHVMPLQGYPELKALRGDDDLSAVLYTGWDARYFYVAIDVTDSVLVPYDSEAEVWRGDCLLLAIDSRGNGGDYFLRDDNLISLALALPKKKKDPDEEEPSEESEEAERPDGKFFVKRKDDGTGAVYEAAIPWSAFAERGAEVDPATGPAPGFQFGFNVIVTDADDNRGARQVLQWAPAIQLHRDKRRLWEGFIPGRFVRVRLR